MPCKKYPSAHAVHSIFKGPEQMVQDTSQEGHAGALLS